MLLISQLIIGYIGYMNSDFILKQHDMSLLYFEFFTSLVLTILKYKTMFIILMHYNSNIKSYKMHIFSAIYMTSL